MGGGIAAIDHVILGVRDLKAARETWRRLGFTPTPRGRHIGQGTANYCIMFAGDYLELLGIVDAADGVHRLDAFLSEREGAMAAAFVPEGGAEAARAALLGRGLQPAEPRALGRRLELPEGTVLPRFSLVSLPPEETPGLDAFLCHHLTPELMRRSDWIAHGNGAVGLDGLHVLVEATAPLIPAYERLFGLTRVMTTDAGLRVEVGTQRITFSTPDDFRTLHPGLDLDPDFPLPGIAALDIAVRDLDETTSFLERARVTVIRLPGHPVVPPVEANETALFFAQR